MTTNGEEPNQRIKTTLQYGGSQYRTTIPLKLAQTLNLNEGDKIHWAFDPTSVGQRKVLIKVIKVGQKEYNDKGKLTTKIQFASKTYRITVPSFIVKMMQMGTGYDIYWAYFPYDDHLTLTFNKSTE